MPTALHKASGTFRNDRHDDSDMSGLSVINKYNIPMPPEDMSTDGKKVWERLIFEMAAVPGWLATTDLLILETLCECVAECKRLKCSWTNSKGKQVVENKKGTVINPTYTAWQKEEGRKLKLMIELGITPSARARVKLEQPKKQDTDDYKI